MSADQLRRAATKLREHAEVFERSPWKVVFWGDRGYPQRVTDDRATVIAETFDGKHSTDPVSPAASTPAYIALVHPPVALALADWLEAEARQVEGTARAALAVGSPAARVAEMHEIRHAAPYAVARAVLREDGTR